MEALVTSDGVRRYIEASFAGATTDASADVDLSLEAGPRLILPNNTTSALIDADFIAADNTGECSAFNVTGTISYRGLAYGWDTKTVTTLQDSIGTPGSVRVDLLVPSTTITPAVTGVAATAINWRAFVRVQFVPRAT